MNQKRSNFTDDQEPLTPIGSVFLRPEHDYVILCAIGFTNPIDIEAIKDEFTNFVIAKVPRFSSLLVFDPFDGTLCWKQTHVKIDDHFIIHDNNDHQLDGPMLSSSSNEDIVNSYLAHDMTMSSPLSLDKPLWELHIMPKHKFMIMKVHHALADGTSLMSLLWSMGRPKSDEFHGHSSVGDLNGRIINNKKTSNAKLDDGDNYNESTLVSMGGQIWKLIVYIWYFLVFGLKYIARFLWVKDDINNSISGIKEVDLRPRKVATASFTLTDMKSIKKAIPNATIYDVLYGIVWCGLTRYLNARCPQALENGTQLTGLCPVNLREQGGLQDLSTMLSASSRTPWGNKFSMMILPIIHYTKQHHLDPLTYVTKAKSIMDRKKQSLEARLPHKIGCIITTLFNNKIPSWVISKLSQNTTFLLSNIIGPSEEIFIVGNPVTFIRVTVSSSKPQAIIMHMVSYKGRADLQIQIAKEIFPDPKYLAKCFQDSLSDMKTVAQGVPNGLTK